MVVSAGCTCARKIAAPPPSGAVTPAAFALREACGHLVGGHCVLVLYIVY
jgi:hypothetical protein